MIEFIRIASTIALLIVCISAVAHLAENFDKHSPECQRYGSFL